MKNEIDITIFNFLLPSRSNKRRADRVVPLGPLYIISYLERSGYKTKFVDYQLSDYSEPLKGENIFDFLEQFGNSEVIGVRTESQLLPFILVALRRFKRKHPEQKLILGGAGPTGTGSDLVSNFPFIDVIVKGEGEKATEQVLSHIKKGLPLDGIDGIIFSPDSSRNGGGGRYGQGF